MLNGLNIAYSAISKRVLESNQVMKITIILASFLFLGFCCYDSIRADSAAGISEKVAAGISAGEQIVGLLNFNSTSKLLTKITKISKLLGPFLGALGPLASLVTLFLPQGESAELKEMKKRFAIMDANFDKVFNRFSEVRNLIRETSLKNQYSIYEGKIMALSRRLHHFLSAPMDYVDEYKDTFIESYRSSYDNAAFIIWRGMMGEGVTFQYDIPIQAVTYTNNHRRKVQEIMDGGLSLILQGVKIHLIYLQLTDRMSSYKRETLDWESKIKSLLNRMAEIDRSVKSKYRKQAESDAVKEMAEYKDMSNAALAEKVYSLLNDKYDWRVWFVVVYDGISGSENHWIWYCGGFFKFRHHGKNMVVASNDKDALPLDKSCAENGLGEIKTMAKNPYSEEIAEIKDLIGSLFITERNAKVIVDWYFPPEYKDCMAPGHGAILKSGNAQFRGPHDRFLVKDGPYLKYYVFQ